MTTDASLACLGSVSEGRIVLELKAVHQLFHPFTSGQECLGENRPLWTGPALPRKEAPPLPSFGFGITRLRPTFAPSLEVRHGIPNRGFSALARPLLSPSLVEAVLRVLVTGSPV